MIIIPFCNRTKLLLSQVDLESFNIQFSKAKYRYLFMGVLIYLSTGTVLGQIRGDVVHRIFEDVALSAAVTKPVFTGHGIENKDKADSNTVEVVEEAPPRIIDESDKLLISTVIKIL